VRDGRSFGAARSFYDQCTKIEPPPHYPRLRDGSLKVTTWFED
jgi:hypothetical protein